MNRKFIRAAFPSLLLALACTEAKPVEQQGEDTTKEEDSDDSEGRDARVDNADDSDNSETPVSSDETVDTAPTTTSTSVEIDAGDAAATADDGGSSVSPDGGNAAGDASDDTEQTPAREGVYAVESLLTGSETSQSYVILLTHLGVQENVKLKDGREFGGFSPADVHDGKVVVGAGESPEVSVFEINEDLSWVDLGTVSFSNYTTSAVAANVSVSNDKIYAPLDVIDFLTWDPNELVIGDIVAAPDTLLSSAESLDLLVRRGYAAELRGSTLFQPYYFADNTYGKFAKLSQISVIDTEADEVTDVLDVDCPHLHITSQDAKGNVYLSNGQYSIAPAVLTPDHPKNCFVRINAGETTVDPDSLTYFADIAEGREGSNFFHVNGDLALFNVYHAERDELTAESPLSAVAYSANYHLWTYNLATGDSAPMEGIGYSGGQFVAYRIDDKVYLTIPAGDYSSTAVYEITKAGKALKLFDVEGWGFKLLKLR